MMKCAWSTYRTNGPKSITTPALSVTVCAGWPLIWVVYFSHWKKPVPARVTILPLCAELGEIETVGVIRNSWPLKLDRTIWLRELSSLADTGWNPPQLSGAVKPVLKLPRLLNVPLATLWSEPIVYTVH